MLEGLLSLSSLCKDVADMAVEWLSNQALLIYGAGYIHLCPVCQKDSHILNPKAANTQRVVMCKCCRSKYVIKVGKHRK